MNEYHTSVLLREVLDFLNVQPDKLYIDATLGGGGHALEILKLGGRVLGIDVDEDAIKFVQRDIKEELKVVKGNFRDIDSIARNNSFTKVSGILFDLGVSSFQLDTDSRGFSFQRVGPLDMRMDRDLQVKAMDLVNGLTKEELYELFTKYGEEPYALVLARSIDQSRRIKPISTTEELSDIINRAIKGKSNINKATKVFQALRIAVNDELNVISQALPKALELLEKDGRLVVISFHSLEDRIVKDMFRKFEEDGSGEILTKKPITPTEEEILSNKRARSAKLRALRKL